MSGTDAPMLAGLATDQDGLRFAIDLFRREGRVAGELWKAFWVEFDKINHDDGTYGAALKLFVARYELWLKEGS